MTRYLHSFFLIVMALFGAACEDRSSGSGPHISVQLVSDVETAQAGKEFHVGIRFKPDPGWHVYWRNPGDSGLAPKFTWSEPDPSQMGEPMWPYPERITVGPLVNYGYGEVLIPFPVTVQGEGTQKFSVALQWLVCKDECLPGQAKLELPLSVGSTQTTSKVAAEFETTIQSVPTLLEKASFAVEEQESQIVLSVIPHDTRVFPSSAIFFPEDPKVIDNSAPQQLVRVNGALKFTLKRAPNRKDPITRIRGVIFSEEGFGGTPPIKAISIDTNPQDIEKAPAAVARQISSSQATPPTTFDAAAFGVAILFALLGGLILNLMPCVFPVLSIKILSFIEHAGEERQKIRLHGIAFTLGVLVSFWTLAIALLVLRASGEQLGWGFQLQSPSFVVGMIFIFFSLGLLFLSDVSLGHTIQRIAGSSNLPTSYVGSFLNGALATAVATPCTGPFMSSAIAATLTLPAVPSFLIFSSIGLGMSIPYLLLSFEPRLLRFLPRPGMWMETFKQLMAFPLLASVVWLMRVFARQMGMEAAGLTVLMHVLWGLLALSFGFWLLARSPHSRTKIGKWLLLIGGATSLVYGVVLALPTQGEIEHSRERAHSSSSDAAEPDQYGLMWEPYSEAKVQALLKEGKAVYLDFTAEWCITCQVNERVAFGNEKVQELLKDKKVALVKGDWTSMNPEITKALKSYGRNGVPLNVLHTGVPGAAPVIFPNILTAGIVVEELEKLK